MDPSIDPEELAQQHLATYDALADEYESRVESLTPVTKDAMVWFARHLKPKTDLLDLGCGVGTTTRELIRLGFNVTAIDISPRMVDYTRSRNSSATCIVGDFITTEFDVKFDAVLAFAFIHLFPKVEAIEILKKIRRELRPDGLLYCGTTESHNSSEGWEVKKDYSGEHKRYRKHWTEAEFRDVLSESGFDVIEYKTHSDPYGKVWMDFIAKRLWQTLPL
jgi:SAM-dependent methyltransferase